MLHNNNKLKIKIMKNAKIHAITNMTIEINLKGTNKIHISVMPNELISISTNDNHFLFKYDDYNEQENVINELKKYL